MLTTGLCLAGIGLCKAAGQGSRGGGAQSEVQALLEPAHGCLGLHRDWSHHVPRLLYTQTLLGGAEELRTELGHRGWI